MVVISFTYDDLELTSDEEKALIHFHTFDLQKQIQSRNSTYQWMEQKLNDRQQNYNKYWKWVNITNMDPDSGAKRFLQDDPLSEFTDDELTLFDARFEQLNRTKEQDLYEIGRLKLQMKRTKSLLNADYGHLNTKINSLFDCS
ncbi:MAG: hypothetical protein EOP00_27825 [Pedobacter sp.]|nr:MAG: hypothetical protein EOP00_27825 [Pedobacter sp.]